MSEKNSDTTPPADREIALSEALRKSLDAAPSAPDAQAMPDTDAVSFLLPSDPSPTPPQMSAPPDNSAGEES